ncbi:MAG TPA: hypothetical protein VKT54_01920 [Steroidobacteraceae bacterium]|nr:hypothetical protein [Steroidobacteraceae bacterium]
MRFRLKAFGLHLSGSAAALTVVLGSFWFVWYQWPGWYLASALHVVGILIMVDLVLGPTLTLTVASPLKRPAVLARDIAIIVTVQLAALVYGAATLWLGRPLYYTFSTDRLELVQGSDLSAEDVAAGQRDNPGLAPFWYSRPRWVWAPLPADAEETEKIVTGAAFGGTDIIQMPRAYRPWDQGLSELRKRLTTLDEMRYFNRKEKAALKGRMTQLGLPVDQANVMVLWGGTRRVLTVFDLKTLAIQAMLGAD